MLGLIALIVVLYVVSSIGLFGLYYAYIERSRILMYLSKPQAFSHGLVPGDQSDNNYKIALGLALLSILVLPAFLSSPGFIRTGFKLKKGEKPGTIWHDLKQGPAVNSILPSEMGKCKDIWN
jgi:hypothetical protein